MSVELKFIVTLTIGDEDEPIGTSEVEAALRGELEVEDAEVERSPW